jgi:hypothetical protein
MAHLAGARHRNVEPAQRTKAARGATATTALNALLRVLRGPVPMGMHVLRIPDALLRVLGSTRY